MTKRVLISTFGYNEGKILSAMRMLSYDKLVLVTGKDSLKKESYKRLQRITSASPDGMATIVVNVFDFLDCLKRIRDVIDEYRQRGWEVILNVSGGTKVLSDAALFAGFEKGVRSYHCEDECIELPVIIGIGIKERFSTMETIILKKMDGKMLNHDLERMLVGDGHSLPAVQKGVRELKKKGMLEVEIKNGEMLLYVKDSHKSIRDFLVD